MIIYLTSDPVQLNLLYEQTKEAIKTGAHPVTIEEARKLAAFIVHITYGNHREDKHQPGTIKYGKKENVSNTNRNHIFSMERFLPDSFKAKAVGSAKKILEIHKKLINKTEIEAKFEYVKMARELRTFGVHFFLVRVSVNVI